MIPRMANTRRALKLAAAATATAGLLAVSGSGPAGASPLLKQCGHVDGTVAVTVTKGSVSCATARAVAKAWDKQHKPPSGFTCKTHKSDAGSGHFGVCKKGSTSIEATPE
jgi:hypothetical protein